MLEALIRMGRADLPALATPGPQPIPLTGALPGLSIFDISLAAIGTALFLLAAYRYERAGHTWRNTFGLVLAPALVIAAFSHLHYMLEPTVFSDRVSSGELLRLAFAVTIVTGLVWEVRPAYLVERSRSRALEAAYLAERERAADLEAADRARAEMLSLLAHELLHPVVAIRATVLAMLKQEGTINDADRERLLRGLEGQSLELKHLTDRIASGARTEDRPFDLIRTRRVVGEVIDELISALGPIDRKLDLALATDRSHEVEVDVPRLIQVMRNLVSNAVKFSPREEPIEVDVRDRDDELIVSVVDRGPGLRGGEEDLVFRPFFRSPEARLSAVPGSGLGLYVVRGIVAAHGGRIWWQRTAEGRSAFRFTVPLADGNGRIDPWPAS
jgi:signal transduction histidine kinase